MVKVMGGIFMEEWKDIDGYVGLYQISNKGRVKSLHRLDRLGRPVQEKILKHGYNKDGYWQVMLSKNGKYKTFRVHRLVAKAFISNPDNLPEVNHIDENKENNNVENLEWCTREYNNNYGNRNKKDSEKKKINYLGTNNPRARKVKCVTTGEVFNTMKEACEKYNISNQNISKCCRGRLKSAGKHPVTGEKLKWEYVE